MSACARPIVRIGVVRYLNTLPLIDGLECLEGVELRHEVPARLAEMLESGEVDLALCSSIDLARSSCGLEIIPVGCLGCHGETLTVRLFARRSLSEIMVLDADTESHTSVALAQIVLREMYGTAPRVRPFVDGSDDRGRAEALLLIGDKAVLHAPGIADFPVRLDLGEAWRELTGLPFVFAVWMARAQRTPEQSARLASIAAVLDHRRRANRVRLDRIATENAPARGWSAETARHYLGTLLDFDFTARHAEGLSLFLAKSHAMGLTTGVPSVHMAAGPWRGGSAAHEPAGTLPAAAS